MIKPYFLYGTAWKEEDTKRCVLDALTAGFRAIDTANQRKHYHEVGVGEALQVAYDSGLVTRGDLFLQSKFTHRGGQDHRLPYDPKANIQTQVMQSFQSSLEHLHTDYLDSYILHGPSIRPGLAAEDWAVWRAMEELAEEGVVKSIGISNVMVGQLTDLCDQCTIKPAFVQNRCYARTGWDREVREFCRESDIVYQGFSLLTANPEVSQRTNFKQIQERHKCTGAQLIFAFALGVGMFPLTGTTDPQHMKEDLNSPAIQLSSEEIAALL